jgi:hypothetical protein
MSGNQIVRRRDVRGIDVIASSPWESFAERPTGDRVGGEAMAPVRVVA